MSASIVSRDWAEAEINPDDSIFGSSGGGKHLLEPLKGWPAFAATFKVMFVEEYRENLDFAKKRRIVMFPLMVALVTMIATIGLQFLVGEGAAQGANSVSDSKTFSWNEMRLALHVPLLMFSLGMGSFAFLGREKVLARTGSKNYLLATPALQPLTNPTAHFAYFVKDLTYYVMLILTPVISGMAIVGIKFRDNIIFVPEVLISARAMKAGMAHIEPILSASDIPPVGTVIMGTVKGDLHDIGKNLCIMMLRGAGFVVHDLGVDTKPDEFIDAVEEYDAQVVGMSALLTTTMPNMGRTIEAFEDEGLRDRVKIMLGGAPVTQEFSEDMGADGYGENAIDCVDLAKQLSAVTRNP